MNEFFLWTETHALQLGGLTLRALGLIALLPLGSVGPLGALRLVLAVGLAASQFSLAPGTPSIGVLDLVPEFFLGVLLALPAILTLAVVSMSSELFESLRGQTMSAFVDPLGAKEQQEGEHAWALLARQLAWVTVLVAGFGEVMVATFAESVGTLPVGALWSVSLLEGARAVILTVCLYLEWCVLIAGACAVLALLVECAGGWITKVLPQVSLTNEIFLLKSVLLFMAVALAWDLGVAEQVQARMSAKLPLAMSVGHSAAEATGGLVP
jgi:flagellar biosynthesis protein FliR